jgi:arylsulfatase
VIIVLVDDMGFSDLGCYGSEIETPNIDRLAEGGLRFTQFYNAGRCCPTRASLLTGLHPHQVGIGHMTEPPQTTLGFEGPYQGYLNDRCVTIAEVLHTAGYHTLMTGKWHVGLHRKETWPLQRGFDRYFGCLSGACNYFKPGGDRGITLGNEPVMPDEEFYATDTFTDYAGKFITEATESDDRPFFLYLAYNAPHWPLNAKWEDFLKCKGKYSKGWEALMRDRLAKQKALGLVEQDIRPAPHVGPEWESLTEKQRDDLDSIMAAYAACIDSIDQNIGKLVALLDSLGQLDNTVIFLLSDNGACQEGGRLGQGSTEMVKNPPLETTNGVRLGLAWANACNTPFRLYKHYVHEGGACTPMIVSWPRGIVANRRGDFVRELAYLPDFMATCVELAGAEYPEDVPPCEGVSMMPLIGSSIQDQAERQTGEMGQDGASGPEADSNRDNATNLKGATTKPTGTTGRDGDTARPDIRPIHVEPIYWEHEGNAAVRWGRWKLVREYQKPWELYDITTDRAEMRDLANSHPEKRDEMIQLWTVWAKKNGVAFPQRFNMYEFLQLRNRKK